MPSKIWFSVKKSLKCEVEPSDVHDPRAKSGLSNIQTRSSIKSGYYRSLSNLREIIHGSTMYTEKPPTSSPRSLESTDFLNSIAHEVALRDAKCELQITGFGGRGCDKGDSPIVDILKLRTDPRPRGHGNVSPRRSSSYSRKKHGDSPIHCNGSNGISSKPKSSHDADSYGSPSLACKKCHAKFKKLDAFEAHHLSNHAVTELVEGNSSRRIVELICRTRWSQSENSCVTIERVLKVNNMQMTLVEFEEHRETVKIKASKLPTKHSRCLADGNELLRFHGTTVACSLGLNGSSSLCGMEKCGVCRILRHGFTDKDVNGVGVGIFTTSTSGRALESVEVGHDNHHVRKRLVTVQSYCWKGS
uniref:C2H2-type domain-containing protein n=1 Tax=Salix viminalis TaxID=40686 RepID=A0A6N2KXC8_SALVM